MLGLISGKYIVYLPDWLKWWSATNQSTVDIKTYTANRGNNLFVNAALSGTSTSVAQNYQGCVYMPRACPFKLRVFGSSTFATYRTHMNPENYYLYDERFARGVSYPGQPLIPWRGAMQNGPERRYRVSV